MFKVGRPEVDPDGDVDAGDEEPLELDAGLEDELHPARTATAATAAAQTRQERRLVRGLERPRSEPLQRWKKIDVAMSQTVGPFIA
jgi:hypothetical protein